MLSSVPKSLRRVWRALPVVAALLARVAAHAGPDDYAGTLPEDYLPELKPILLAALKSPRVISRELEIAQSEAHVIGVDSQRLPNVFGHLDYVYNQTAISGNSATENRDSGALYGLAVSQPLFHWGALANQSAVARIEVAIAEKNFAETYRLVAVDLRQRYLGLIVKKAALRHSRLGLPQAESDLKYAKDELKLGNRSPNAVAAQQLGFDEASLGLAHAEAEFAGLRRSFARIAGMDDLTEDAIPLEIAKPVYASGAAAGLVARLQSDGAKSTLEAQIHEAQIHQADLNYKIANVRLRPNINAGASLDQENTTNATTNSVLQQSVARQMAIVTMQWSIFDGLATKGLRLEALNSKRLHEHELKKSTQETVDRAQELQGQIEMAARALDQAETHRLLAAGELTKAKEENGLGNVSTRIVADRTRDLYFWEANSTGARATLLSQWAELVSLAGLDPVLNNLPSNYVRETR